MLTHSQIWKAIDGLAARNGLSASGLARRAGLDPTTFNKSKRITADGRERWPSTESVSKALAATNSSIASSIFSSEISAFVSVAAVRRVRRLLLARLLRRATVGDRPQNVALRDDADGLCAVVIHEQFWVLAVGR